MVKKSNVVYVWYIKKNWKIKSNKKWFLCYNLKFVIKYFYFLGLFIILICSVVKFSDFLVIFCLYVSVIWIGKSEDCFEI